MNANARWQEVIAENLASSSIPGARKQELSFAAVEAGITNGGVQTAAGHSIIPSAKSAVDFQPGALRPTGGAKDLAIEGTGFFEVQLPNGARAYTRDGEFHMSAQGQLVTKQGYQVMSDSGALQFDSNNPGPISVSADGTVSQGADAKGHLKIVEFQDPRELTPMGHECFSA